MTQLAQVCSSSIANAKVFCRVPDAHFSPTTDPHHPSGLMPNGGAGGGRLTLNFRQLSAGAGSNFCRWPWPLHRLPTAGLHPKDGCSGLWS